MCVLSAHGAAPSQLDAVQPSHTSNQSKDQSIACGLMFIKATHIHLCTSYCTLNTAVVNVHRSCSFCLAVEIRGRYCLKCREMLIFNYAFSWSRECIMWAAFMKGKYNGKSKCICCPQTEEQICTQGLIHIMILSPTFLLKMQCFDLM